MTSVPALTGLHAIDSGTRCGAGRDELEALPRAGTHIPALDGIRGVAILLVLVTHFFAPLAWAVGRQLQAGTAGRAWIVSHLLDAGWVGVDLFFVLSGFLITGILADAKGQRHYFRNFYARRSLRVFPLYYGLLLVVCVLLPALSVAAIEPGKQGWLWTYGVSLFPMLNGGTEFRMHGEAGLLFTHFWSLAVEEHFYLVWPLTVCFLGRKSLMNACVGLWAASFIARALCAKFGASTPLIYETTFLRMDGLLAGAWVALALRGNTSLRQLVRGGWAVFAASGLVLLGVGAVARGMIRDYTLVQTLGFSALAIFFASGVLLTVASPGAATARTALSAKPLRWLGRYSYGIYVYHGLLLAVFDRTLFPVPNNVPLTSAVFVASLLWHVAASTAVTLLLAYVSYHAFEKHFLKLKRFFPAATGAERPVVTGADEDESRPAPTLMPERRIKPLAA